MRPDCEFRVNQFSSKDFRMDVWGRSRFLVVDFTVNYRTVQFDPNAFDLKSFS